MLYQTITAAGVVTFTLNLILKLRNFKVPHSDSEIPQPVPPVSVLIPARDKKASALPHEIN